MLASRVYLCILIYTHVDIFHKHTNICVLTITIFATTKERMSVNDFTRDVLYLEKTNRYGRSKGNRQLKAFK